MKSRTSCFNQALFKKNITRFCPVWLLYLVGLFLMSFGLFDRFQPYSRASSLISSIPTTLVMQGIYAFIVAQCLFGDLFNQRMCNAIHALPVRREQLFFTNVLSGLAFSIVPNMLAALLIMPQLDFLWYIGALWLLAATLAYIFFFALSAVCALSTGSRFAMSVLFFLINFLSQIICWFVDTFYMPLLPGLQIRTALADLFSPFVQMVSGNALIGITLNYSNPYINIITNIDGYPESAAHIDGIQLSNGWWYLAGMAVVGCLLLWAGIWLYRRRKLEQAGEFIVFRPLMPVCSAVFTLSVAAAFYLLGQILSIGALALIIGFPVGCFCAEMLLRRTVRVFDKKTFIKCGIIGGVFALSLLITALDPIGLTRWTPKTDNVISVTVESPYYKEYYYDGNYTYKNRNSVTFTEDETIQKVINIHENLLTDGLTASELPQNRDNYYHVRLIYTMTSGVTIERYFYYEENSESAKMMEELYLQPEYIFDYAYWNTFISEVQWVRVYRYQKGEPVNLGKVQDDTAKELVTAAKTDAKNGLIRDSHFLFMYQLEIKTNSKTIFVIINSDCKQTLAYLDQYF